MKGKGRCRLPGVSCQGARSTALYSERWAEDSRNVSKVKVHPGILMKTKTWIKCHLLLRPDRSSTEFWILDDPS